MILADMIKQAMKYNGVVVAHIYGDFGFGKTSYALWVAYNVLGSWNNVLNHLFFTPREALVAVEKAIKTGHRLPIMIMDDAGLWLDRLTWWQEDKVAFMEFFNLIRSVAAGVLFTTPSEDLPKPNLKKCFFRIHVSPAKYEDIVARFGEPVAKTVVKQATEHGLKHILAVATGYKLRTLPSFMNIVKKEFYDIYPLHYPVYEEYEEKRRRALSIYYTRWKERVLESVATDKKEKNKHLYMVTREMLSLGADKREIARKLMSLGASKSTAYYIINRVLEKEE